MRLYKVVLTPLSPFGTYPKGDSVFGQFAYHLFKNKNDILKNYLDEEPRVIFSDMMPEGYIYKPTLPLEKFNIKLEDKKEFRKKEWITLENLQSGNLSKCEDIEFYSNNLQVRNALNRLTFMTDSSGDFAPYGVEEFNFNSKLWMFILIDKSIKEELVKNTLDFIGKWGFGKDSSIGKGRFKVDNIKEFNFKSTKEIDTNYYLSISPTILENTNISNAYYSLFHRFGKFGQERAMQNPFKKPVLMANSGAVVNLDKEKKYIGKSINSGYDKVSFLQGYSIAIPFKLGEVKCKEKN